MGYMRSPYYLRVFMLLCVCGCGKVTAVEVEPPNSADCSENGDCNSKCQAGADPDCKQAAACGQDGTCDLACAAGKDPDCEKKTLDCGKDGVCEESCSANSDPDCVKMADCSADKLCNPSCEDGSDPDCKKTATVKEVQSPSFWGASGTIESKNYRLTGYLGGSQTDAQGKTYRLHLTP